MEVPKEVTVEWVVGAAEQTRWIPVQETPEPLITDSLQGVRVLQQSQASFHHKDFPGLSLGTVLWRGSCQPRGCSFSKDPTLWSRRCSK